ncbi:phosphoribosylformylglycinamidine synthase subunit PurQ [Paralimibaculum aggregatum]|uniref:Phosphoribosylformylglycinamidine synthase subunit PurQ n=1 Tax=Paralimibaculum aggregatum TaxID=3036245 RepID=A0ABQ6LIZ1_9RHOB|nr:phosphoribosylformylglycinamidine synthase subunit PurQ [Limibaculum sp. NKW23]GMG83252.1 phosphoribosylformylglycinamidine synthase subunit PurQ [Limibaculum sp. NKW23]
MRAAVIVFPGSNCDRDMAVALEAAAGRPPAMVWHKETALPEGIDLVALPGGFSFGDYLRCGAIAARAPIMAAVRAHAAAGGMVLGVCNGWQVLIEAGLLPGALMRNASLKFVCRDVHLAVGTRASPFTQGFGNGAVVRFPVAHHDGAFVADERLRVRLAEEDRVAFRYTDAAGKPAPAANPNGSTDNIAGVLSENRRVLGMMPHPERLADPALGGKDGAQLFASLAASLEAA